VGGRRPPGGHDRFRRPAPALARHAGGRLVAPRRRRDRAAGAGGDRRDAPGRHRAIAVVEVADAGEEQSLEGAADLDVLWVHRDGPPPGTTSLLADAVVALPLPAGDGRAWGGGEALAMRHVRRHLREDGGIPAAAVSVLGYWKHRDTETWE
jgi:hypothetical protein